MKIGHIGIYTTNLELMKAFYEKVFKAKAGRLYHNEKTGFKSYFLEFDGEVKVELMCNPDVLLHSGSKAWFHLALQTGSREWVDDFVIQYLTDGNKVISMPRVTGDGYYEAVIEDPEGNVIEIVA